MEHIGGVGTVIFVVVIMCAAYYLILSRFGIFRPAMESAPANPNLAPNILPIIGTTADVDPGMALPPKVDSKQINLDEMEIEFIEDAQNILLKEAERVVEQIQDTIDHIASNPPNPEEVTTKIRTLVLPYQIFLDTEYYDSINTYIALAVERDCAIKLSADELKALWN